MTPALKQSTIDDILNCRQPPFGYGNPLQNSRDLSSALSSIGYARIASLKKKEGSFQVWSRKGYVPPSFLKQDAVKPSNSIVVFYQEHTGSCGIPQVGYLFMTKPGVEPGLIEIAYNAQVIHSRLIRHKSLGDRITDWRTSLAFPPGAVLGLILSRFSIEEWWADPLIDGAALTALYPGLNALSGIGREKRLVAGMRNPGNYFYGEKAAGEISEEFARADLERVALATYAELEKKGSQPDRGRFYEAFTSLYKPLDPGQRYAVLVADKSLRAQV